MLRRILIAALLLSLTACGFHLRGPQALPFATIYLEMNQYSDLAAAIKRQIATSGTTKVVNSVADAQVRMVVARDTKEKHILSLSSTGTVREYELRQRFAFRVLDKEGKEVTPLNEIYIFRTVSFATGQELAKEQEEALLYRDMESDLVQQLMRRLAATKSKVRETSAPAPSPAPATASHAAAQ